jgi:chromosome segregation ATPase
MSRHISDSENVLSELRGKLQQAEGAQAAAEAERAKLVTACDEANELRQSEAYALGLKLDGLRSRAEATEKLLAEARQSLVVRTEELRSTEGKLQEATAGKREAEKRAATLAVSSDRWESQVKKLERSVDGLNERCKVLSEVLTAREGSLAHANDKNSVLTEEIQRLQQETATARAGAEEEIVKLNADIQHERAERAVIEGSLETARGDYARILRQLSEERAAHRRDQHARGKADPAAPA